MFHSVQSKFTQQYLKEVQCNYVHNTTVTALVNKLDTDLHWSQSGSGFQRMTALDLFRYLDLQIETSPMKIHVQKLHF